MATQIRDDSGACSLLVALRSHSFAVASAGDCQGVLVYENGTRYKELTTPHRAGDRLEKQRIYAAGGFVKRGRVMGVLEPSRTIGGERAKRASLWEDENTRDEVLEIATDGYIHY